MRYKLIIILSFICFNLFPQHDNSPIGARSAGMGNSSVCLQDLWAAHNNQAGLADLKNIEAGVYYENRFLLKELSFKSLTLVFPTETGVFGLDMSSFGFSLYNENKFGLAYSKRLFKNISMGIQLDYLNTHIAENYGNKGIMTFEGGINAQINKQLILAAHIYNPLRVKLSDYNDEHLPSILKFGILYKPIEEINLCAETEKDINLKPVFIIWIVCNITISIYIRTGISTNPAINAFGFGFEYRKLKLDFSSSIHQTLGYSPQFSISYVFY